VIKNELKSYIHKVNILANDITELVIHSPLAAANFRPGQFFRLQNYSDNFNKITEPLALTGAHIDKESGLISLIILEVGKSSKLCRNFKEGEEVILMGPTGEPTKIVKDKNVVLIGGGLGNAVLLPIAEALRENNCHVTYFAGYRTPENRFYPERIERNADRVIWACEQEEITPLREGDSSIKGNILDALFIAKKAGLLGATEHVICIGSDGMMRAVVERKQSIFGDAEMICSINSPMQCMMKGICGQCIQKINNEQGYIFSCICQDQKADIVDFEILKNRLTQNSLLEKI
jgi:NAD(P)H-flavin reductase